MKKQLSVNDSIKSSTIFSNEGKQEVDNHEGSNVLGFSVERMRQLGWAGIIPRTRKGRKYYYRVADIISWALAGRPTSVWALGLTAKVVRMNSGSDIAAA